jgi:hypothetical protein
MDVHDSTAERMTIVAQGSIVIRLLPFVYKSNKARFLDLKL